jgi:hypothetical protein
LFVRFLYGGPVSQRSPRWPTRCNVNLISERIKIITLQCASEHRYLTTIFVIDSFRYAKNSRRVATGAIRSKLLE